MPKINRGGKRTRPLKSPQKAKRYKPLQDKAPNNEGKQEVGRIDMALLKKHFPNAITDEVIVTDERVGHVKDHHPNEYDLFKKEIRRVIAEPDEIIKEGATKGTLLYIRKLDEKGYKAIVRVTLADDAHPEYKNGVMSFYPIGGTGADTDRAIEKLENKKNNVVIYKRQ